MIRYTTGLPPLGTVSDIRMEADPAQEAWLHHFLTENNIDFLLNPGLVASPEQLRFMVALREGQVYIPASDAIFRRIYERDQAGKLLREYAKVWRFVVSLIHGYGLDRKDRQRIMHLCRYRFQLYLQSGILLPSRLIKRLVSLVLRATGDTDPFREKKREANRRVAAFLADPAFQNMVAAPPASLDGALPLPELRWELDYTELSRLFRLATYRDLWEADVSLLTIQKEILKSSPETECLRLLLGAQEKPRKKILYIPDVAGGFMVDMAIIRSLLRQGHQIILALKEAFYFNTPVAWDMESDPAIKADAEGLFLLRDDSVSKNELLRLLRENRLVVISDGTSEQMNLYRTSVTFARAWKECDLIIAKGRRNARVFLGSSHEFTRDVLCFWREDSRTFRMQCKPKASFVRKFSECDLKRRADDILAGMRNARSEGKSVMFYSALIGSLPGQTRVALDVVTTFVNHLRGRMENTYIINPAEHFEEGLDGDDLMFMWERVQRGGLLDVWRFQTVNDIEASFAMMGRKVPSPWLGKDSTYSTGCTKEMYIALDVQKKHPELQIIGPSPKQFFRRREYGVGKYFDERIAVR